MKNQSESSGEEAMKDHYELLGLKPTASQEEIGQTIRESTKKLSNLYKKGELTEENLRAHLDAKEALSSSEERDKHEGVNIVESTQMEQVKNEGLGIAEIDAKTGEKNVEQAGGTESENKEAKKAGDELVSGVKEAGKKIEGAETKTKSFEEQWENPKLVKVIGSGKYGLMGEFIPIYDISPEKPKTEVPFVIGMGWGAIPESDKKGIKYWTEHGRRVIVADTPHGISAEKKEDYPAIEIEKMTALYETLRASGIYMKEDGTATGQIDLMGRSEGAIFSTMFAYFYPKLVRNLVLENPAGMTGKTNKGIFAMRWMKQMKQDMFKEYKEAGTQPKDYLSEVLERNLSKSVESVLAISGTDVREMLKEIKTSGTGVSLITTTEDRFFPPEKLVGKFEPDPLSITGKGTTTQELTEEYVDRIHVEEGTHNSYFWEPEKFAKIIDEDLDKLEAEKGEKK